MNVAIQQLVGDEAGGLTKLATCALGVIKGSDLFHIQQEITKGLTGPLARAAQQYKETGRPEKRKAGDVQQVWRTFEMRWRG